MRVRSNFINIIVFIFSIAFLSCNQEGKGDGKRTEIGQEGLVAVTMQYSKHYPDYLKAARLLQENKPLEAIEVYEHLCKIEADSLQTYAYMGLATAYLISENHPLALRNYNKSTRLNRKNVNSYIGLGSVYFSMKDYKKAIEYYDKARKIDPHASDCYWGLAISYYESDMKDSASAYAKHFLSLEPNSNYRNYAENILMK